ncbi:transglycosylase domain-containing protein [Microbacterium lacus]|uniref:transglycosylase domain-containing protein n=1 Tax=Microbacterium lacus TaxID=415217 RepID=UPI00384F0A11
MPDTKRTASGVAGGLLGLVGLSAVAGVLITATVTPAIALTGNAATSAIEMFDQLPSVLDIDSLMLPATMYAMNYDSGEYVEMAKFYDQNRSPVEFDQIAPVMYDAILSSEDPRYYQHGGIDLIGTTRALVSNLQGGGELQGGSSISQQYVKNILVQRCERDAKAETVTADDGTVTEISELEVLQNCWTDAVTAEGTDGIQRKLQEMRYAISLEQKYSKNDILLGYLNIANFGGTTYGIDAAAKYYFGVPASGLSVSQAAILAGIVQNPNLYRIDQTGGTSVTADGIAINAQPDGQVLAPQGLLAGLDTKLAEGEITQEQYLAAADGYTSTKGRQLYVLSRMLDDGKITQEQYDAAVIEPITPNITRAATGCVAAVGAEYFCQYVKNVILQDEAFGATQEERLRLLQRAGLNIYTTLDSRVQSVADAAMAEWTPTSVEGMVNDVTGIFGGAVASIEAQTGRILAIAQNTEFNESADVIGNPNYSSLIYAADSKYGRSDGFAAGSTFKLFTLIDWLEKGHSVNETLNGRVREIERMKICGGDWVNVEGDIINNFNKQSGYTGTPMQFTRDSLNTGYFAMAEKLDLCDVEKVAAKMGVTQGNGNPVTMGNLFSVIGSTAVSPIAMAGAYATVANNGIYCQPKAIDRVTNADGTDIAIPQTTCTQVLDPKVAATAAYALEGVMAGGGTGRASNTFDGVPLIGKTGTNENHQTWMIESSTKVATAVWVGNSTGEGNIFQRWFKGVKMSDLRHQIAPEVQRAANAVYGGDRFAAPDNNLTRRVLTDLPNVVGMSVDQARQTLESRGFSVEVGSSIDSGEAEGVVAAQNPGAGRVNGGSTITISPSNGQGISVPDVSGRQLDRAISELRAAGFGSVIPGTCTQDGAAQNQSQATGTQPAAGSVVNRNAAIVVDYKARNCTAPGNGGGNG